MDMHQKNYQSKRHTWLSYFKYLILYMKTITGWSIDASPHAR